MAISFPSALLFDLDGTLTDSSLGITRCIAHALAGMGCAVPTEAELRALVGPPLQRTFPALLGTDDPAHTDRAIALYRERFAPIGMFENSVYAGIPEALTALRAAGHTLYVATSKPAVYAAKIAEHFGLAPFFQNIYGSELTGERVDKAELIAYVLAAESLDPARTVMIGDRHHDIVGGRANDLYATVGVTWGYGGADELRAAGAVALCSVPEELPNTLGSL